MRNAKKEILKLLGDYVGPNAPIVLADIVSTMRTEHKIVEFDLKEKKMFVRKVMDVIPVSAAKGVMIQNRLENYMDLKGSKVAEVDFLMSKRNN